MKLAKVFKQYSMAVTQAEQFHPIFRQYQRLAANVVRTKQNPNNPFPYGEGTAASIIRKMPQRVLKQMPIGRLRNISNEFMAIMCEFIVDEIFARNARRQGGLIQNLWAIMEDGITFGWSTVIPFFTKVNGAYTVDFKKFWWADVYPACGVRNINEGDVFLRDWWTKEDIKALIKMADEDESLDKDQLKQLLDGDATSRDSTDQSEPNKRASVENYGYEVIRYYVKEDGKYMLYIFKPGCSSFIQKKELPSRGHVSFYFSPDFETAYGRSILGLIGGIQIDLDQAQMNKRKAQEIETNPMLVVKGWTLSKVQVRPGTMIQLPPEASIEPFALNTPSLDRYIQDHSANQALIYQLAGYPEANTPSDVTGSSAIGKTPAAIKQAQSNIDSSDNQISHHLKLFLEQLWVESLKIYFANLPEQFLVEVSQEYAQKIAPIAPERFVAEGVVIVDNELDMFDYEIDIESGAADLDTLKLDSIMKMLGLLEQSPMLAERTAALGIADDLIKEIIFASGLNNDTIARKLSFLDNPNMGIAGQPGGDPLAGQSIPMDVAMQMQQGGGGTGTVQTQPPNPIRQMGGVNSNGY